jgi:very-short-patch-repair endonuclease
MTRAKHLRINATDAERQLWQHLRRKQMGDLRFRRQFPLGPYVVDFVCLGRKLIVELDGGQHAERGESDQIRTAWLTGEGFTVIRFWNDEVVKNMEGVLARILERLNA